MSDQRPLLTEEQIAAFLEGGLPEQERLHVERVLAKNPAERLRVADTAALLARAGLLPPPLSFHPLERLLAPLARRTRMPVLACHAIFLSLVYLLWAVSRGWLGPPLPWHRSLAQILLFWPVVIAATSCLFWLQIRLRQFVRSLWREGIPADALRPFARQVAWLQGWPLGGLWLFLGIAVASGAANAVGIWPLTWEWAKETIVGLYEETAVAATLWGGMMGGFVWHQMAQLLRRYPVLRRGATVARARRFAQGWLLVASVAAAAHVFVQARVSLAAANLWSGLYLLLLLTIWVGYARFEWAASTEQRPRGWGVRLALRLATMLAVSLAPVLLARAPF